MSDVRVPREATEAAWRAITPDESPWFVCIEEDMQRAIEAALPFLRAQWEADLLSDEAIERVLAEVATTATGGWIGRVTVENVLRAALGSRFVPEEPKDAP